MEECFVEFAEDAIPATNERLRSDIKRLVKNGGGEVLFADATRPVDGEAPWFECVFKGTPTESSTTKIVIRRVSEEEALNAMLSVLIMITPWWG